MPKRLNYQVSFTADTGSLQVAVDKAVQSLQKLGTSSQFQLTSQLKEASSAALDLSTHLTQAFNQDTGQLDLITFNNQLKQSGLSLSQYADKLVSIGPAGEAAFMNVAQAITKAELPLRRSNALLDSLWVTMKNTMRWQLTSSVLHGFMGGIQTAYGYTKDLNESLNSIQIVTGKSSEEMARFADQANKAAKALSTTTTQYTDASLIYYQQGLPDEQVEARTNTTIKLANVARESAQEASEQLTAIWNNFAKGGENLEYYVDVMAALGATTASSTQEISDGVQKFAAVADTVGLSYEYAASALATITATTRESADVVGTALRTLFARIQGLMQDGEADDGTTLNKYSKALAEVGIQIKDTEGNLKDMDTILNEMGNTWGTLTQAQQMALAQTVAGVRQYTQLIALMNNWQFFQENLTTAMNSEGTLEEQAQIYAESWEAARDRVRAASEDIYDSLINDDFYIGLDNAFTPILNRIADVIDGLGGMRGVLSVVGLAMNKVYGERIAQSLRDFATNINIIRGVESQRARDLQAQAAELTKELSITDSANQARQMRLNLMQKEVILQGTINEAASSLDGSQRAWLETEQQKIALMEKEVTASAEIANNFASNAQQSRDIITTSVDVKEGWQDDLKKKLKQGFSEKDDFVVELDTKIKTGNIDTVVNSLLDQLGKLAAESSQVERLSAAFKQFDEVTDQNRQSITELYASIKGIDVSEVTDIDAEFEKIKNSSDELNGKIRTLTSLLRSMGIDNSSIVTFTANIKAATIASNNAEIGQERLEAMIDEVIKKIKSGAIPSTKDWASALVKLGTAASQISLAVNALNNLFEVFEDDNIDGVEKFTRILTSIGMIIPTIVNGVKALQTVNAGAAVTGTAAAGATAATGAAAAGATGAVAGLGAAFSAALPVIAAIAGLTALVVTGIAHFIPTAEKAEKAISKLTDAYEEAESELESLQNELETTQQKINELGSKDKLELVDKNELNKLKEQERYLQSQIDLQERAAKLARQNQINGIVGNYLAEHSGMIYGGVDSYIQSRDEYEQVHGKVTDEVYQQYVDNINMSRQAWTDEHAAELQAFQEEYNTVVAGFQEGLDVTEKQLTEMQERLALARKNMYGEEYNALYVEPILDTEAAEKVKSQLYNAIRDGDDISGMITGDLEKELQYAGVSVDDFSAYLEEKINGTADAITEKFQDDVEDVTDKLNSLTAQEWDVLATIQLDNIDDVDELWAQLEEHKNNVINVDVQTPNYDELHEVIDDLKFSDIIKKEDFEKLGDWSKQYFVELMDETYQFMGDAEQVYAVEQQRAMSESRKQLDEYMQQIKKLNEYDTGLRRSQLYEKDGESLYRTDRVNAQLDVLEAMGYDIEQLSKWREELQDNRAPKQVINDIADALVNFGVTAQSVKEKLAEVGSPFYDLMVQMATSSNSIAELAAAQSTLNLEEEDYAKILEQVTLKEAEKYDIDPEDIIDLADAYLDEEDAIVDTEDAARQLAIQNIRLNRGYEDLVDNWEEWSKVIKKVNLGELSKTSLDYVDTIQELTDVIADLVGTTGDLELSDEFFESAENIGLIEQAAQGSEEAISQLGVKVATDMVDSFASAAMSMEELKALEGTISDDQYDRMSDALENLSSNTQTVKDGFQDLYDTLLEGGPEAVNAAIENGDLLGKEWTDALNEMAYATNMTVDQMESMFNAANLTTDVTTVQKDVTQKVPVYETIEDVETISDGSDGMPARYRKISHTSQIDTTEVPGSIEVAQVNFGSEHQGDLPNINPTKYVGNGSGGISPSRKSSGSKGGGGGGSSQPKKEDRLEQKTPKDIDDRYHEINRTIQEQDELLQDIDEDIDLAYGTDRLKLFQKQIEELNKQADNYRGKMDLAAHFKDIDKNSLKEVLGLTDEDFDPITGEVLKYQDVLNGILDDYNAFGDKYNAFIDKYNGMTAEQQEAAQDQLDALKEEQALEEDNFNQKLDALGLYEDSLDEWRKAQNEFEEAMRAIEEAKLNEITHKVDVIIEIKNAEDAVRDFTKQITESFSDSLYNQLIGIGGDRGRGTAQLGYEQAQAELELFKSYEEEYDSLMKRMNEANKYTNMEDLKDEFLELQGNIISSGEALLDWIDSIEHMLPDAIDAARERFDQFTNQLSHNQTMLDTIEELYTLQGQTYKTQQGFNRLQSVAQERVDAAVANATLNRQWSQRAKKDLDAAQQALDDLMAEYAGQVTAENPMPWESDVRYDTLKANRDALLQEFNDSQEAMYQSAQEAMQAAQDMYLQQIEKAVYNFGQTLSDNVGLDLLQNKYDHYIESEGRYFDKVNEAYNVAAWYNKLQKAIDDSQNSTLTKNLQALQQEIDARREGGKLSEYDLEILEAKYKVLEAQAALEDAQNNKNELRLTRDRQGNLNYQYNANPDEVADKQQELLDAENEWYNLAKQQVEDVTGEIVDTWNECSEQIKDIYSDMTLTDEERAARAEEIYAYYAEKVKYLEEEKQNAIKDMTEAGNKSLFDMAVVAGDEVTDLTGITAQEIQDLVDESGKSLLELLLSNNDQIKDIVGSNSKLVDDFDNVFARDLSDMTKNAANFEDELRKTLDRAQGHFDDYENKIADVADNTGTDLYEMDRKVQALSDSTDECRDVGDKLVGTLWNMLDPVYDLTVEYSNLARSIMDTVNAMQQLAGRSTNAARTASGDTFFNDLDYSTLQAAALASGDEEAYNYLQRIREAKIKDQSLSEDYYVTNESTGDHRARIEALAEKGWSTATWGDYTDWRDIVEELKRRGFATGGYTGTFDDAKLAFLHEKELVLNQDDTENILAAVSTIRALSPDLLRSIEGTLDSSAVAGASLMGQRLGGMTFVPTADSLQQTVYINADFSGVSDRNEIVEAMNELVNMAAQRARRRTS